MKTITINAYSVKELSPKAFKNAHQDWINEFDWFDYDCYLDDIKKLLDLFYLNLLDYSLNCDYSHHSYAKYKISDDNIKGLNGVRLWKYLENQMPSLHSNMSYSYYEKPLMEFLERPSKYTDIYDIINDCLHIVFKSIVADYEYQISEDNFIELCDIQGMLFNEDGERIR